MLWNARRLHVCKRYMRYLDEQPQWWYVLQKIWCYQISRRWSLLNLFSRDDITGRSVVNYVIGTMKLFGLVRSFSVLAKYPESDHRPISFSLLSKFIHFEYRCDPITNCDAHHKYIWARNELNNLESAMSDGLPESFRMSLLSSIRDLCDANNVAEKFDEYIFHVYVRETLTMYCKDKRKVKARKWHDYDCSAKCALAITTGERVTTHADTQRQTSACRAYRSCKQRRDCAHITKCVHEIQSAF